MSTARCFYPNGSPSLEEDIPCGDGDNVACCPEKWTCQSNGLCYYDVENYYGRYTCTDKNWGPGCPEICTYDHTAGGNEAVLECDPGSYCCDSNRPELSGGTDCCKASSNRFSLNGNLQVNSTSEPTTSSPPNLSPSLSSAPPSTLSSTSPISISSASSSGSPTSIPSTSSTIPPTQASHTTGATQILPSTTTGSLGLVSPSSTQTPAGQSNPSLDCNSDLGELNCGSICCTNSQFCVFPGQCSAVSHETLSSSSLTASGYTITTTAATFRDATPTTVMQTSIISYPHQNTLSYSVVITPSTPSDISALPTDSVKPASVATQSPSVIQTKGFKIGVGVGTVVVFFIIAVAVVALYLRQKHKRGRRSSTSTGLGGTLGPQPAPAPNFTQINPPSPHPYRQRFPLAPSILDERGSSTNRSRLNDALVPDQEQEQYHQQPTLRYPPPLDPYAVPQANQEQERRGPQPDPRHEPALDPYDIPPLPTMFANRGYGNNASPVPSYTTEDPNPQPRRQ